MQPPEPHRFPVALERYEQFISRHPRLGLVATLSGVFLTAVGLAGVPEDLENWSIAFQAIDSNLGRWLFLVIGLSVIGVAVMVTLTRRSQAPVAAPEHQPPVPQQASRGDNEFGRRDDRGELAQRCHMLAASIERWVAAFNSGHSQRAEKYTEEGLKADPSIDPAEARRTAYTHDEKQWELDYRLKYQDEAVKLFREAWEMGEVAKEHERLAAAPLAIEFEKVPRLFNAIADRLYGEG